MRAGAFTAATRALICERAGGRCERCQVAPVEAIHHRRPRGSGGSRRESTALASNGVAICNACHNWAESHREEATRKGWLVRQSWEPRDVAVFVGGRWVMLSDDGGYVELPPEAE